jgi:Peptidase of plants and bacteria
MTKNFIKGAALLVLLLAGYLANAQTVRKWEDIGTDIYSQQTIKKEGLKLLLINKDTLFSKETEQNLIDVFFKVYPQEVKRFYPKALRTVTIVITREYSGVAATENGIIKINPDWLKNHPEDYDLLTHELMHVTQTYSNNDVPFWLTEGIADYARCKYGVNNEKAGWSLTPYRAGQNYKNAYRITARFLVWLEINKRADIVDQLNTAMRTGIYTADTWTALTGKTVDELWAEYAANPNVNMA